MLLLMLFLLSLTNAFTSMYALLYEKWSAIGNIFQIPIPAWYRKTNATNILRQTAGASVFLSDRQIIQDAISLSEYSSTKTKN